MYSHGLSPVVQSYDEVSDPGFTFACKTLPFFSPQDCEKLCTGYPHFFLFFGMFEGGGFGMFEGVPGGGGGGGAEGERWGQGGG